MVRLSPSFGSSHFEGLSVFRFVVNLKESADVVFPLLHQNILRAFKSVLCISTTVFLRGKLRKGLFGFCDLF